MDGSGAWEASPRAHHPSHHALLRHLLGTSPWGRAAVDAVVVPAGPDARPRSTALYVALRLGCPLVVLCHPVIDLDRVAAEGASAGVRTYAVRAVPPGGVRLPDAAVAVVPPPPKQRNISVSRNLGLLLARLAGWRRILFLDDDVHDVDVAAVRDAGRRIHPAGLACVGWVSGWYPDNSVVCHANRLAGNRQGSFVSTATLVCGVDVTTPHFPAVYNEDWLFMFDLLRAGRVGHGGRVLQLPYDPYAAPVRAYDEEFGDLLAEGLFHLLHEARDGWLPAAEVGAAMTSESFWRQEIDFRWHFVKGVRDRLEAGEHVAVADPSSLDRALASLTAAADRLTELSPGLVVAFVEAWRDDARDWTATLRSLYPLGSLLDALDRLHVVEHSPRTD